METASRGLDIIALYTSDGSPDAEILVASMLKDIWTLMIRQNALKHFLWRVRADESFYTFRNFLNLHNSSRGTFPFALMWDGELAGMTTMTDAIDGIQAEVGIWIRRKFWGEVAQEIGIEGLRRMHAASNIPRFVAYTPLWHAYRFCQRIGMSELAKIPNIVPHITKHGTVFVMYHEEPPWE